MRANYNRKTKYLTVSDHGGLLLMQKCFSVTEARKIARQHGAELEVQK